jgi:MoxR-like ATPase
MSFKRIQFTPDLMPSDITGTEVIFQDPQTNVREFRFLKGPIFANMILADEINRTPPKTQAAMLEAMQERKVTVGGNDFKLPDPFFVLATQNPIEQEGTYRCPKPASVHVMILYGYPSVAGIADHENGHQHRRRNRAVLTEQEILDPTVVRQCPWPARLPTPARARDRPKSGEALVL